MSSGQTPSDRQPHEKLRSAGAMLAWVAAIVLAIVGRAFNDSALLYAAAIGLLLVGAMALFSPSRRAGMVALLLGAAVLIAGCWVACAAIGAGPYSR